MRISPASRLVIVVVVVALVVVVAAVALGNGAGAPLATSPAAVSSPNPLASPSYTSTVAATSSTQPTTTASPQIPGDSMGLASVLATLVVAPEHRTGYARTLFELWIDADGNGCDTRHEVLIAEAVVAPGVGSRCSLSGGRWISDYDGLTFTNASSLDIDHVVPLAEAWDSGAFRWTADRRKRYANDLDVPWALIAVSATSNRSKGDQDPADWLPPLVSFRCTYVTMWIEVKARWSLTVDPAEDAALQDLVAACPSAASNVIPAP